METGDKQTIGTGGFGVESSCVSSDGVRSAGRIAVGGTTNERRPSRRRRRTDKDDGGEDRAAPRVPNQVVDVPAHCTCQACQSTILSIADHYAVQPCGHTLCNVCLIKSHIERGCKPHTCPIAGCHCYSTGILHLHGGSGNESTLIRNRVVGNADYVKSHLPVTWLKEQHCNEIEASEKNEGIVLSCTKIQQSTNGKVTRNSMTSTFVLHHKGVNMPIEILDRDRALEEIGRFFGFLHEPIAQASNCLVHEQPVMSPRECLELRCDEPRLLDRALFALSTSNFGFVKSKYLAKGNQDHQKQYLAAIISSDILLRAARKSPGIFQLMFNDKLAREQVSNDFKDLCSALSITPCRKHTMKGRAKIALERMKEGIDVKPRDLVLLFFDNVGFKVLGRQASYDQWIVINTIVIPEAKLKELGFYQDDNVNKQISRVPDHIWEDEIEGISIEDARELTERIVGIQDHDYERLSECTMENIKYALDNRDKLSMNNQHLRIDIPRFDCITDPLSHVEMIDLLENGHPIQSSADDATPATSPHNQSAMLPRDGNDNATESTSGGAVPHNRYTRNFATMEVVHEDLSQTKTVKAILDYGKRSNASQLLDWDNVKHLFVDTAEAPLAEIMAGFGCDGQPAEAIRRILELDAQNGADREFSDSFFVSFGGFHTVLKSLNASGEYFEELLKGVWSSFRDTIEKVKWILFPSDPRQRESDYSWCLLAHYWVAASELRKHLGKDVSAVEVNDFMIQRAIEYPICALALLEIRVGTVIKLMRNSEKRGKRGCVSLFFTAIRLIMPLFAVTHKTDYMNLCQEILKWYYCASPAQRKIYEELIFTQLTANGTPIFHDIFVELSVMNIRAYAGKTHYRGLDLAMELIAAKMSMSAGENTSTRTLRDSNAATTSSRSRTHDTLSTEPSCPFYKVAAEYVAMGLWTHGVAPTVQGHRKGTTVECKNDILEIPGGGALHSFILSAITGMGRTRTHQHFMEYYIINHGMETRSDKIVDLTKINTTVNSISEKINVQLIFETSTIEKDFKDRVFTKAKLMEYIHNMCTEERNKCEDDRVDIDQPPPKNNANKDTIVSFLVKWRSIIFEKNPEMKQQLIDKMQAGFAQQSFSSEASRMALMDDTFFKLSPSVLQRERYTGVIFN